MDPPFTSYLGRQRAGCIRLHKVLVYEHSREKHISKVPARSRHPLTSGNSLLNRRANADGGLTTADNFPAIAALMSASPGSDKAVNSADAAMMARPANATLSHFELEPRFLHLRANRRRTDVFDSGHGTVMDSSDPKNARAHRLTVDMNGACPALRGAAAELCSRQTEDLTKCPKQWHVGQRIERFLFAVDCQFDHGKSDIWADCNA
jgi:hypothetical protein